MKKIVYKVISIREYDKDFIGQQGTFVRVDQLLYDGPAYAEMDSTVYDIDDFQDIHILYQQMSKAMKALPNNELGFEYDYSVYFKYVEKIKRELMSMQ